MDVMGMSTGNRAHFCAKRKNNEKRMIERQSDGEWNGVETKRKGDGARESGRAVA